MRTAALRRLKNFAKEVKYFYEKVIEIKSFVKNVKLLLSQWFFIKIWLKLISHIAYSLYTKKFYTILRKVKKLIFVSELCLQIIGKVYCLG